MKSHRPYHGKVDVIIEKCERNIYLDIKKFDHENEKCHEIKKCREIDLNIEKSIERKKDPPTVTLIFKSSPNLEKAPL